MCGEEECIEVDVCPLTVKTMESCQDGCDAVVYDMRCCLWTLTPCTVLADFLSYIPRLLHKRVTRQSVKAEQDNHSEEVDAK